MTRFSAAVEFPKVRVRAPGTSTSSRYEYVRRGSVSSYSYSHRTNVYMACQAWKEKAVRAGKRAGKEAESVSPVFGFASCLDWNGTVLTGLARGGPGLHTYSTEPHTPPRGMSPPPAACRGGASTVEEDMDRAFGEGDFEKGVALLRAFGAVDKEAAFNGCDAIWELATSESNAAELGDVGACEVVAIVLRAWGRSDEQMAWNGCSAISNLAYENEANRARLGAANACELVVDMLGAWGKSSTDVAVYGRRAIFSLRKHDCNQVKLTKLGALSVLRELLLAEVSEEAEDEL
jgi:hypothetical protein